MTESFGRPGVYVREAPLAPSLPSIASDSATGALFGAADEGPVYPTPVGSWRDFVRLFNVDDVLTPFARGVYQAFANGADAMYVCRVTGAQSRPATLSGADEQIAPFIVYAKHPGAWGNALTVEFKPLLPDNPANEVLWDLTVRRASSANIFSDEVFAGLSLDPDSSRFFATVINDPIQGSQWVTAKDPGSGTPAPGLKWLNVTARRTTASNDGTYTVTASDPSPTVTRTMALEGGVTFPPLPSDYKDAASRFDTIDSALLYYCTDGGYSYDLAQSMAGILPGIARSHGTGGDSFAILDTHVGCSPSQALALSGAANKGVGGTYGAVYYPHIRISNPSRSTAPGATIMVPPGAAVVGSILAVDRAAGPWVAPAGTGMSLAGVTPSLGVGVERSLTADELDMLNANTSPVNAIRSVTNSGVVIMGARTTNSQSIARYVSVRRALNMFKRTLARRCETVLFEPITARLMSNLTVNLEAYLTDVWQDGGLAGATTEEAFYVICDTSNNTPADMAVGRLNVDVGLALLVPAEYVVLRVGQFQGTTTVTTED